MNLRIKAADVRWVKNPNRFQTMQKKNRNRVLFELHYEEILN